MAGTAEEELCTMSSTSWISNEKEAAAVAAAEARVSSAAGASVTQADRGSQADDNGQTRTAGPVQEGRSGEEAGEPGDGGEPRGKKGGKATTKQFKECAGGRSAGKAAHVTALEGPELQQEAGGAGGSRVALEKRGVRNLFFLHLHKVPRV